MIMAATMPSNKLAFFMMAFMPVFIIVLPCLLGLNEARTYPNAVLINGTGPDVNSSDARAAVQRNHYLLPAAGFDGAVAINRNHKCQTSSECLTKYPHECVGRCESSCGICLSGCDIQTASCRCTCSA